MPQENRFPKLREVMKQRRKTQAEAASDINVPRETFNRWIQGTSVYPPTESEHRSSFLDFLYEKLSLKDDSQTLHDIWEEIVYWWRWEPLNDITI